MSSTIYVNSRIYEQRNTGIGYYIQSLFAQLKHIDTTNTYIFLQTSDKKKLGSTVTLPGKTDGIGGIIFDVFMTYFYLLFYSSSSSTYFGCSFLLPFWKIKRIKYVVTIHDLSFLLFPKNHSYFFNLCYGYFTARAVKNADEIIALSENTKNDIVHFYGSTYRSKIHVVYPGINPIFLSGTLSQKLINEKYIFSVSTHLKRKNIFSVIQALSILKKKGIIIKYIIAGSLSHDQQQQLLVYIKEHGLQDQVLSWGYVTEDDLISLYQHSQVFIYPSFYEGFGFPVIEGIFSKTLVITSDASSTRELLTDKNFLVNPSDVDDIAHKIEYALSLDEADRQSVIQQNIHYAQKFDWNISAQQHLDLL